MTEKLRRNAMALRACGQIMFGEDWHAGLCRGLHIDPAELDAILAGSPIPGKIWDELDICMASARGQTVRRRPNAH